MEKRRLCGAAVLLLTTAVLACASRSLETGTSQEPPEEQPESIESRQVLRDYFTVYYRENECASIYADVTHDGREELLVVALEPDPAGEPILLHGDAVDPDRFTQGQVIVLGEEDGAVSTLYTFPCGTAPAEWGGLYLMRQEERVYLLRCDSHGEAVRFALAADGTVRESAAAVLTEQAKPLLVYGGAPETFACLDELFTAY